MSKFKTLKAKEDLFGKNLTLYNTKDIITLARNFSEYSEFDIVITLMNIILALNPNNKEALNIKANAYFESAKMNMIDQKYDDVRKNMIY